MPFHIYFGWGLLFPVCLSFAYGLTVQRVMNALDYVPENRMLYRFSVFLLPILLFTACGIFNIPLPLVYILILFGKVLRLLHITENRPKELFLINFTHLTMMALHMILLSLCSLATGMSIHTLLLQPFWRIFTVCIVLFVNILVIRSIPRWDLALEVLRTQSDTAEVKPFLVFLIFCNAFLLLDSVLCVSDIHWQLQPLFLVSSTVLLEFYLVRFLKHLYTILKERYLEEEYNRLTEKLGRQNRNAAALRSKTEIDAMTGVFSRKYGIEQTNFLVKAKTPFSFVFIDLDHLKEINDRDGHHAGDLYLIRFAQEFGSRLRKTDILARVGGDEFIVLLPDCTLDVATRKMEHIRQALTEDVDTPFLFSYGVAYASKDTAESVEEIFRRADQAMYRNKEAKKRQ